MRHDVVVIGAGFAGLSAAAAVADGGARVLVLEAAGRLGGRAASYRDGVTGERVDNGQHVLFGCYHETRRFLTRVSASHHLRVRPVLDVTSVTPRGDRTRLVCPPLGPPLNLLAGLLEWDALDLHDRLAVFRLAAPLRSARRELAGRGEPTASPGETVTGWLTRHGQTRRLRELLWEPLALAALNQSADVAAAPTFVRVLAQMTGSVPSDSAVALPARALDEFYAEPARQFIEAHGGEVRTQAKGRVRVDDEGVCGVEVEGERFGADVVISAVPWFGVSSLFAGGPPPELAQVCAAADEMGASPIVTVNLWLDRSVLDVPFIGLPGRAMQWVFDKQQLFGDVASHLSLVSSGASTVTDLSNAALVELATTELRAALPLAAEANVVRASVVREPRATFSLAPDQPPRPKVRTGLGRFFLAGDWTDTGLPGTIESAVVSGHLAAGAALERLGHSSKG